MARLGVCSVLILLAWPCVAFSQAPSDLAQQVELRAELAMDYNILQARQKNNQTEYSAIGKFCSQRLTEPALRARRAYCSQKTTEFNNKDSDLRAQLQKLAVTIQQLDAKIIEIRGSQLQKPRK